MDDSTPLLTVVIPVLNDARNLARLLHELAPWRALGDEIIVVDGGSSDDSVALAAPLADRVIRAERGRAAQQNAGAALARGSTLWFVHADSGVLGISRAELLAAATVHAWGRCAIRIDDRAMSFRLIEAMMNLRTRVTAIVTGDHGMFVRRAVFDAIGGIPNLPLMEDIEFSRALARNARPCCLVSTILTSSRRWRRHGIVRTVALMWLLRLAWFFGVPAARLARLYGYAA